MFDIPKDFFQNYMTGDTHEGHRYLGAHVIDWEGFHGVRFCVFAPSAKSVHVTGTRNNWSGWQDELYRTEEGFFVNFFPHYETGDIYRYLIETEQGELHWKSDPYAFSSEKMPLNASVVTDLSGYCWNDQDWLASRAKFDHLKSPISIYEVNLASWRRWNGTEYYSYERFAEELTAYVKELGSTHVELMPISEYPFDGSWGYQQTGYFSANSRFGEPKGLMYLIDILHQSGIGVFLDWVPSHFAKDSHGLSYFDGHALYESAFWSDAYNEQWDTMNFDFARAHVRNFFYSNARFWAELFHADGFRVDAVAYMIFPKAMGQENKAATAFLQQLNILMGEIPGFLMMAEDSTAYDGITRPVDTGGLGFHYKWNMGWMNDTLSYFSASFEDRKQLHQKLTFPMMYAFSEHFILPLSHDEVVHLKHSLLNKMPGYRSDQFKQLRLLYLYQYTIPGKKLLFMGGEFAQSSEWNEFRDLDWFLFDSQEHLGIWRFTLSLIRFYKAHPALYEQETGWEGFRWLNADDSEGSTLAYERISHNETLTIVLNLSPVWKKDYFIKETDKAHDMLFHTEESSWGRISPQDGRLMVDLPPLSGVILKEEA